VITGSLKCLCVCILGLYTREVVCIFMSIGAGISWLVQRADYGLEVLDLNTDRVKGFLSSPQCAGRILDLLNPIIGGNRGPFSEAKRPGREFSTHLRPVPRLRINGAIPLLPLYTFMAWTGITLPFCTRAMKVTFEFGGVLNTIYYITILFPIYYFKSQPF
jgi:hypothetical protein